MQNSKEYYNSKYFQDQKKVGLDNVKNIGHIFCDHIETENTVLDFGCGGGFLIDSLVCKEKHGFEVNEVALKCAKDLGIQGHSSWNTIEDEKFDVVISNSCLEHTPNPLECLQMLNSKLKTNGKLVLRVPHETLGWNYKPNDWNYHLYTWSPMALGNLVNEAGFKNISVSSENRYPLLPGISKIPVISRVILYFYRVLRIALDELRIKTIASDGYCIVVAKK